MKKYLYATTALIGVGAVATAANAQEEGLQLSVGGFTNHYYGFSDHDIDGAGVRGNGVGSVGDSFREADHTDTELWLDGSFTLDNGIEVGASLEVEYGANATADEQIVYFRGSFGEVRLGQENSAAYDMNINHTFPGFVGGVPINTGWYTHFAPDAAGNTTEGFRTPATSTFVDSHNDANTVEYRTPRIGGFMLAASWTPQATGNNAFGNSVNDNVSDNNSFSIGAGFQREFSGVSIGAGGGWTTEDSGTAANAARRAGADDQVDWFQGSLRLGYAGFTIGGGVAHEDSGRVTDGTSFNVALGYSTGPWTVGAQWFSSDVEGQANAVGDDEKDVISGGVDYLLGPGVSVGASVVYANYDNQVGEADSEAIGAQLGTSISF